MRWPHQEFYTRDQRGHEYPLTYSQMSKYYFEVFIAILIGLQLIVGGLIVLPYLAYSHIVQHCFR